MEEIQADKTVVNENQPVVESSLPTSSSEPRLSRAKLHQARRDGSLASVGSDHQQTWTNRSHSLEENYCESPQQNSDNNDSSKLSASSPLIEEQEQTPHEEPPAPQPSSDKQPEKNEIHLSDAQRSLSRWDKAWSKKQQQEAEAEAALKKETSTEANASVPAVSVTKSSSASIDHLSVREFVPDSPRDPTLSILRDLFVRSFDEFYKEIEGQLHLNADTNLIQWLDETFNNEQKAILSRKYRCFLLCGNENEMPEEIIVGFLTLKEEDNGSIYIAQVAIRADIKRRGYGARLLQHLRNIYPPNTQYWGLCRRANRPALQFYLKQGATFMENDEVGAKYGYDPAFYAGFEFLDKAPQKNVDTKQAASLPKEKQNKVIESTPPQATPTPAPVQEEVAQETSPINENPSPQQDDKKKRKGKLAACCVLS